MDASGNISFCGKFENDKNSEIVKTHLTDMTCDYCSWIREILARINTETQIKKKKKKKIVPRVDPVIVVHGGAGKIPQHARKFMLDQVKRAAVIAYCDLLKGCCSLDAVERAIRHMESKKYFNCAYGGSLDANGEVVMDAAIMTNDLRAGCVGAVRNIAHPITLAKLVLQQTEHVLIVEDGAQKFALESNLPALSPSQLTFDSKTSLHEEDDETLNDTRERRQLLQDGQKQSDTKECIPGCVIARQDEKSVASEVAIIQSNESPMIEPDILQLGAVGAVAYDRKKRLASGTSTAGEAGKLYGNVSATGTAIGCGIYVDQGGSVSVSGCEQAIYKYAPAQRILRRLRCKTAARSIDEAVAAVLRDFEQQIGVSSPRSDVGAIAVTAEGVPFVSFKCAHFPWAYCDKGYVYYGCTRNERFSEKLDVLERPLDCVCEDSD